MTFLKRLATATPAFVLLALFLVESRTGAFYGGAIHDRPVLIETALNVLLLAAFVLVGTVRMRQRHLLDVVVQASFFVYIWGVLYHTLLPLPFADIYRSMAGSGLVTEVLSRVEASRQLGWSGVNLVPFHKFTIYGPLHIQVTGNLALLLPLGIYLPVLSRRIQTLTRVLVTAFSLSLAIETAQLLLSLAARSYYRSFDVDDIILNTVGAGLGFGIYRLSLLIRRCLQPAAREAGNGARRQ